MKPAVLLFALASCAVLSGPASARRLHHLHPVVVGKDVPTFGDRRQVLETNGLGDRVISGRIGLHRSHLGDAMVPDAEGPSFIASGRASRSGVAGANGLPGSNF